MAAGNDDLHGHANAHDQRQKVAKRRTVAVEADHFDGTQKSCHLATTGSRLGRSDSIAQPRSAVMKGTTAWMVTACAIKVSRRAAISHSMPAPEKKAESQPHLPLGKLPQALRALHHDQHGLQAERAEHPSHTITVSR